MSTEHLPLCCLLSVTSPSPGDNSVGCRDKYCQRKQESPGVNSLSGERPSRKAASFKSPMLLACRPLWPTALQKNELSFSVLSFE